MTRRLLLFASLVAASLYATTAHAQSLFPFLQEEILGNNPTLHSQALSCESTKLDNNAGLTLANPEVGVSYMFGQPSDVPNKTNIDITQTFDFATLSGAKRRVAEAADNVADGTYMSLRSQLALDVENAIINYIYQLKLVTTLDKRLKERDTILTVADKALQAGTITYPDYNEIQLEHIAAGHDLELAHIDLEEAHSLLVRLNGGKEPGRLPDNWPAALLPQSFDEWIHTAAAVSPELASLQANIRLADRQVNLRKKESLPEFSIGYVNELVSESNYHGVAIGLSLPLWGNSSRIKAAKSSLAAARQNFESATDDFRLTKKAEYDKAVQMLNATNAYTEAHSKAVEHSKKYLDLALQKGTMNRLDYLRTLDSYTDYTLRTLEATRDFQLARAALYAPTF